MKLYELRDLVLRRNARFALNISEFSLERGEKVAVVGPNGSGKTTFLRLLSLLDKPDSCAVFSYLGRPHTDKCDRNGMGLLNQQPYLFKGTVAQNLAYPLRLRRFPSSDVKRRIETMLSTMELEHLAHSRARELSGGEQKRLALGRVLIADPDLLLLDEPTSHLDVRSQSIIENVLATTNKTVLLATHNLPFAFRVTDRVLHLREGRVTTSVPENILEGCLEGNVVQTATGLSIELPSEVASPSQRGGEPVTIVIDPKKIALSTEPQPAAPQNEFRGRISAVREQGNDVWLKVDCGTRLTAIISRASYEELGINLHKEIFVSFGSHDVEVVSNPHENARRRKKMEPNHWSYKSFHIKEGLKPESRHFQYFYSVSEGNEKKCKYCIWIEDDALATHDPSRDFGSIASRYSEQWRQWVKAKIDGRDFRNLVLKHSVEGQVEIDLEAMDEKLTMD